MVVVGGGHNGLVAAAYLARAGLSTLVLERLSETGGAAARLAAYPALATPMPEPLAADLGLDLPHAQLERVGGQRLDADLAALAEVVAPTLLGPLPLEREIRDRVDPTTWCDFVTTPIGVTIERRIDDDAERGLVAAEALAGTFASPHDESLEQNRTFLYRRLCREGRRLVAGTLAGAAAAAGAEILTSAGVSSIRGGDDGAEVTWHDGMSHHTVGARFVLANVAPWVLRILLGEPEDSDTRPEGAQLLVSVQLDRAVELPETLHVGSDYTQLQAAYDEASAGRLPSVLPGVVHGGSNRITFIGHHTPARLFADDPQRTKDLAVARVLASLTEQLGEPIDDHLVGVDALTPPEIERELAMPGGHIHHGDLDWPWAPNRARLDTPAQQWGVQTDVGSVLICGSGSRRGGAVPGLGGHSAAHAVLASR